MNWDPGNAFFAGETPYPDGYRAVRGLVGHVHFKDARRTSTGELEYVADGQIDWAGQIRALQQDGYSGYISVETHLRPKVAEANAGLARLRQLVVMAKNPLENIQS